MRDPLESIVSHASPVMTRHYANHADDPVKVQHLGSLAAAMPSTAVTILPARDDDRPARIPKLLDQLTGPEAAKEELRKFILA